jgi:hypothetical protein
VRLPRSSRSLATILLEVSYTRIFLPARLLLHLRRHRLRAARPRGGGVLVALFRPSTARAGPSPATLCAIAPVSVVPGYLVVATVQVNAFDMIRQVSRRSSAFVTGRSSGS